METSVMFQASAFRKDWSLNVVSFPAFQWGLLGGDSNIFTQASPGNPTKPVQVPQKFNQLIPVQREQKM